MKRHDTLTKLPLREQMEMDLKAAISGDDAAALALVDVDYFGNMNLELGPDKGDAILAAIAELLRREFPDRAYRVSGDEFAVFLPGCTLEQAFLKLESFRRVVHESQEAFGALGEYEVTVTAGVAQYPRDAKDAPALLRAADAALGSAKESGRNQVALPPNEEMVMKSCYYPSTLVRRLKTLSDKLKKKESALLREALGDLIRKYDRIEENG